MDLLNTSQIWDFVLKKKTEQKRRRRKQNITNSWFWFCVKYEFELFIYLLPYVENSVKDGNLFKFNMFTFFPTLHGKTKEERLDFEDFRERIELNWIGPFLSVSLETQAQWPL